MKLNLYHYSSAALQAAKLQGNFVNIQWGIVSPTECENGIRRLRGGGHQQ